MSTTRLNITLPNAEAERLKKIPNKSAFIAAAVKEKFDAELRLKRDETLAEAYKAAAGEDAELAGDWDALAGEGL